MRDVIGPTLLEGLVDLRATGRPGSQTRPALGNSFFPVWTPDGTEIVFSSTRVSPRALYRQRVDGGGEVGQIQQPPSSAATANEQSDGLEPPWLVANSITPDGESLVVIRIGGPLSAGDLWLVPLNADREPVPLLATSANEILGDISPDGRWLS